MEELNRHIGDQTRLLFGTAVEPRMGNRMAVMLLSALSGNAPRSAAAAPPAAQPEPAAAAPDRTAQPAFAIVARDAEEAPVVEGDEMIPDLPSMPLSPQVPQPDRVAAKLRPATHAVQAAAEATKKREREAKQEQLTFEPVTRGRFEKSEPTIVDGQDLDVPAFMRRNMRVK